MTTKKEPSSRDRALSLLNDLAERMDDDAVSTLEAVEELHDAGLLAPDLPELSESSEAAVTTFGEVYIRYSVDDIHMTPAEARDLADDLYAAANHAEGVRRADA